MPLPRNTSLKRLGIYILNPNLSMDQALDKSHDYTSWLESLERHKAENNFYVSKLQTWDILNAHKASDGGILIIFIDYNELAAEEQNALPKLVQDITNTTSFSNFAVVMRNKPQDLTTINSIEVYTDNEDDINPLLNKYERKTPEAIQSEKRLKELSDYINQLLKNLTDYSEQNQKELSKLQIESLKQITYIKVDSYDNIKNLKTTITQNIPILSQSYTVANILLEIFILLCGVGILLNIYQYKTAGNFGFFVHNHTAGKKAQKTLDKIELAMSNPYIPS